jgi:hypothetical protein
LGGLVEDKRSERNSVFLRRLQGLLLQLAADIEPPSGECETRRPSLSLGWKSRSAHSLLPTEGEAIALITLVAISIL